MQKTKHVATRLADGGHLGDDWQVVDDEADLIFLYPGQVVGVAEDAEASDICGAVGVVLVHETGGCNTSGHLQTATQWQNYLNVCYIKC